MPAEWTSIDTIIAKMEADPVMAERLREARIKLAPTLHSRVPNTTRFERMMRGEGPPDEPELGTAEEEARLLKRQKARESLLRGLQEARARKFVEGPDLKESSRIADLCENADDQPDGTAFPHTEGACHV